MSMAFFFWIELDMCVCSDAYLDIDFGLDPDLFEAAVGEYAALVSIGRHASKHLGEERVDVHVLGYQRLLAARAQPRRMLAREFEEHFQVETLHMPAAGEGVRCWAAGGRREAGTPRVVGMRPNQRAREASSAHRQKRPRAGSSMRV